MEHKDIPNNGLHEPKDIVFASPGQVYVADGNGSGQWMALPVTGAATAQYGQILQADGAGGADWVWPPGGWAVYADSGAAFPVGTVPTALTIDGMGEETEELHAPRDAFRPLWEEDEFVPVRLWDVYSIVLRFTVSAVTGSPTTLTVRVGEVTSDYVVAPGTYTYQIAANVFDLEVPDSFNIMVSVDSGSATITDRKVRVVQVHGA